MCTLHRIIEQAQIEIEQENKREQINKIKEKIRSQKKLSFWRRLLPWKITITKKDKI